MKAYVLHGINDIRFEDVPVPSPRANEVLLKVCAAGICGSDIPRIYKNGAHVHPIIPGHEFSGIVEAVGDNANEKLTGKRMGVFPLIPCMECVQCKAMQYEMCRKYNYLGSRCNGAFAEYVAVPVWNLIELPDSVSYEKAAMLEPFSVAAHAMRAMIDDNTDRNAAVLVWGAGTIGIMLVMLLKSEGFSNVLCVANKMYQADILNKKIGIDASDIFVLSDNQVLNGETGIENGDKEKAKEWLASKTGSGASLCFECVGKNETLINIIECAAPSANIMLVGNPASDMSLSRDLYWKILRSQLTIKGTWNSSFTKEKDDDWHYVLSKLSNNEMAAEDLISHRFKLENLSDGFEIMRDKSENYIKCMYVK